MKVRQKLRIPMIGMKKGFKPITFKEGVYKGGCYVITSGGTGILYKVIGQRKVYKGFYKEWYLIK